MSDVTDFPLSPRAILEAFKSFMPAPAQPEDEERRLWDEVVRMRVGTFRAAENGVPTHFTTKEAADDADEMIRRRRSMFPAPGIGVVTAPPNLVDLKS